MNLAAFFFPRLAPVGFDPRRAFAPRRTVIAAPVETRTMPRHAIFRPADRRLQLRVVRGCVWITRDGCPADMVLNAGDVFDRQPGATVLVQALEETELIVAGTQA